jgi:hypothetical protein
MLAARSGSPPTSIASRSSGELPPDGYATIMAFRCLRGGPRAAVAAHAQGSGRTCNSRRPRLAERGAGR